MISIAIIDDEIEFIQKYTKLMKAYFQDKDMEIKVKGFTDPNTLLDEQGRYDIYFLDVEMPQMNGIELAKVIRKIYGENPELVFVTSREDAVFDCFSVDAMGFVRKNVLEEDFHKTMEKFLLRWRSKNQRFEFKTTDGFIYKSEIEIMYAEVFGHKMTLYCDDGSYQMRGTIDDLQDKLSEDHFVEPHRGYLVNCHYIERIGTSSIFLDNGVEIPLSKRKKDEVRRIYLRYLR